MIYLYCFHRSKSRVPRASDLAMGMIVFSQLDETCAPCRKSCDGNAISCPAVCDLIHGKNVWFTKAIRGFVSCHLLCCSTVQWVLSVCQAMLQKGSTQCIRGVVVVMRTVGIAIRHLGLWEREDSTEIYHNQFCTDWNVPSLQCTTTKPKHMNVRAVWLNEQPSTAMLCY